MLLLSVAGSCLFLLFVVTNSDALTAVEKQQFVDIHNEFRRGEGSSNMQIMSWSDDLALYAQNWSDACSFTHGQGIVSATLQDLKMGQNLYVTSSLTGVNLTYEAVIAWFNEKADYDYALGTCASEKVCGHYTQVVWDNSNQVGCGYTMCSTLTDAGIITTGALVVCNYAPGGNVNDEKPYLKGSACTQCDNGKFYCHNGLCDGSCTAPGANCVCSATCQNCANVTSDCRCQCDVGWTGIDCSTACQNIEERCDNGWSQSFCSQYSQVLASCPVMCGVCVSGTPSPCAATNVTSNASTAMPVSTANPVSTAMPPSAGNTTAQAVPPAVIPTIPKRRSCLVSTRSNIPLKPNPRSKKSLKTIVTGDKFVYLGKYEIFDKDNVWLKVRGRTEGRLFINGWVNALHFKTKFVNSKKNRKKMRCL